MTEQALTARPDEVLLDDGRRVDVVEEVVRSAPLGLRFWDPATDRPVVEGLLVQAQPEAGGPISTARPSSSGVHGFGALPTTRDAEHGSVVDFGAPVPYRVLVIDTRHRFVTMSLTTQAPVAGVQPVSSAVPGHPLFSSALRPVPAGQIAVRLDLRDESRPLVGSPDTYAPAAHALVVLTLEGAPRYAVADATGRALVLAPAPVFASPSGGSGPIDPQDQAWPAVVEVRYEALTATGFPGVPDFSDIAGQAVSGAKYESVTSTSHAVDIEYGEALVVRSPGRSDLLVTPA
ncbi:hypothetical protein [Nocardioides gilvus]|uniref:hypothetical protein n=1 Tax=Nocardioides gilvus TaxID=1735589 RepID=UPI000D740295|nr:hypothetical protein [Nocardioides gilvus]